MVLGLLLYMVIKYQQPGREVVTTGRTFSLLNQLILGASWHQKVSIEEDPAPASQQQNRRPPGGTLIRLHSETLGSANWS